MKSEVHKRTESVFLNSTSRDELFDAFTEAINSGIDDFDLYKILIGNPFLSIDEIKMYSEKLLKVIPLNTYHILMWTASIFESYYYDFTNLDNPINYYERALNIRPTEFEPYLSLLRLYSHDIETDSNKKILSLVEQNIIRVVKKSKVYYALADLYKRRGDLNSASRYLALAEKSTEFERE